MYTTTVFTKGQSGFRQWNRDIQIGVDNELNLNGRPVQGAQESRRRRHGDPDQRRDDAPAAAAGRRGVPHHGGAGGRQAAARPACAALRHRRGGVQVDVTRKPFGGTEQKHFELPFNVWVRSFHYLIQSLTHFKNKFYAQLRNYSCNCHFLT